MSDSYVQLPPNSTGQQIRTEIGDQTNQIPTGVGEEVVIPSDAQGLFPGDARQQPLNVNVTNDTMLAILEELREIKLLLS